MQHCLPLPEDKKLLVTYRVEPGCLGPDGIDHIEEFCQFSQRHVDDIDADYVHWKVIPRYDKTLPELQYNVLGKKMTHQQAAKYLAIFDKDLDQFEGHLCDKVAELIDQYLR